MSDTPITDAIAKDNEMECGWVTADFARRLERDRAELIEVLRWFVLGCEGFRPATIIYGLGNARALLARLEKDKP